MNSFMPSHKPGARGGAVLWLMLMLMGGAEAAEGGAEVGGEVYADKNALRTLPAAVQSPLSPPAVDADSWLLADFSSGWIIGSVNAQARIEPASLSKLMTAYLVFAALATGEVELHETVRVSEKAWRTSGSRMFIEVGKQVAVEDLLQGLVIQSGNDAAVALAQHVAGSEAKFAVKMNQMAARLGMRNSHFINSHGLPQAGHYSTALDMTILARALIRDFPHHYRIYSQKTYTYNHITQKNRNQLLWRDASIDGIKTGHTENAGYCLIGTARRQVRGQEMRLLATVLGARSETARAEQTQALLEYGFAAYESQVVYQPGDEVATLPLWMGQRRRAQVGVARPLGILYPAGGKDKLSGALNLPASLAAPLTAGQAVGSIEIKFGQAAIHTATLHVNENYREGAWWRQALDWLKRLIS